MESKETTPEEFDEFKDLSKPIKRKKDKKKKKKKKKKREKDKKEKENTKSEKQNKLKKPKESQYEIVKRIRKRRYEIITNLKNKLEFNEVDRAGYRINGFIKRRCLTEPFNSHILPTIPGKYRCRFQAYTHPLMNFIIEEFNTRGKNLMKLPDVTSEYKNQQMTEFRQEMEAKIMFTEEAQCFPLVIDIRRFHEVAKGNMVTVDGFDQPFYISDTTRMHMYMRHRSN